MFSSVATNFGSWTRSCFPWQNDRKGSGDTEKYGVTCGQTGKSACGGSTRTHNEPTTLQRLCNTMTRLIRQATLTRLHDMLIHDVMLSQRRLHYVMLTLYACWENERILRKT